MVKSSESEKEAIPGATVFLKSAVDSSDVEIVATNATGAFRISKVEPGNYLLRIQSIGFSPKTLPLEVKQDIELGTIFLDEKATGLEEVVVTGKITTGTQKGDTTQYNAAAFKTLEYATGQDLVEKMPGITNQGGALQAQGEAVQQILVDGKRFFGNDVEAALQNLPAEAIESIQIYDKKSDKAELSGFDDGEAIKTINIITKANRRRAQFGRATAGYGTNDRYMLGSSINFFNDDQRITLTGLTNNINAMDYSADPNSQGESRTQDGIITTNILGLNYSDDWGEKIELSGSYLFSNRENEGERNLIRDYVLSDSNQVYYEDRFTTRTNMDHRFDLRLDYKIDSNNRILWRPDVSLKNDRNSSFFLGRTETDRGLLNRTENNLNSDHLDYDYNNDLFYSHQFRKTGRSFTLSTETGYHTNTEESERLAENIFYRVDDSTEIDNQYSIRERTGFSWEADFSYTEPLGENGIVELEYEIGNRTDDSEKLTYDLGDAEGTFDQYSDLDTGLSNVFKSAYLTQEVELGYQYSKDKLRLQVEAEYQRAELNSDQQFPKPADVERTFHSLLPTLRIDYKFSKNKNLEFDYDTRTREPSVGQLQDVIDNSNPLHLSTGNPNLDQSFNHRLRVRYRSHNPETEKNFFLYAASSIVSNNIVGSSFIAQETTVLEHGIVLEEGSQLTRPVNIDGYWDFRSYASYGQPVDFIKSNLNLSSYVNYSNQPGMVNGDVNVVNSSRLGVGVSISSNISEYLDFNVRSWSSYNLVENSLRASLNNNYFNQSTRAGFDWVFWRGFRYGLNLNHQYNSGLAEEYDNNFLLMNMSIGKKFLENEQAEVSLSVYDLLGQNNSVRRNVTELYVEDVQANVLQRYVMLRFTYNIRHFSQGTAKEDYEIEGGAKRRWR